MTEVSFYHLEHIGLEIALPKLLEKTIGAGERALVLGSTEARLQSLSNAIWTCDPDAWLPHGTVKDGFAEDQPIWLSTEQVNLNHATFLFLIDGMAMECLSDFKRCLELFDGKDPAMIEIARNHWSGYKEAGHDLVYWQQSPSGSWEKKAEYPGE